MEHAQRLRHLFISYLQNTCSQNELDELLECIKNATLEDEQQLHEILDSWYQTEDKALASEMMPDWEAAKMKLMNQRLTHKKSFPWIRVAASLLLTIVASYFFITTYNKTGNAERKANQLAITTLETNTETRLVTLPDGSTVWLNGNSKINFPASFGNTREVSLTGEAFFDIKHDDSKPFIIQSNGVKTTVLGTAFNIRAFPKETAVVVTVKRGKVKVEKGSIKENVLTANQQLSVNVSSDAIRKQELEAASVTRWTSEEDIILDNIAFEDAVNIIEEHHAVKVQFSNPAIKACRFTSTFLKDASLEQMLTAICMVNNATYKLDQDTVTISGGGCQKN